MRTAILGALTAMTLVSDAGACPELNRFAPVYTDAQLATIGGSAPNGALAADDFLLPTGTGGLYDLRRLRVVFVSDTLITSTNVNLTIYNDGSISDPTPRPVPGTVAASAGNDLPTVVDLGAFSPLSGFRLYEVSWVFPAGAIRLAASRWYWASPTVSLPPGPPFGSAYAAVNSTATIVGEVVNKSDGNPGGTFGPWQRTTACCLLPSDLAMYVDAVQAPRSLADITCDGVITLQDLFSFLSLWFSEQPEGNYNGVAGVTIQDLFDYLAAYFGG